MIISLAWKNIWRNPVRSWVVIGAVIIGVFAGVFMAAFSNGMTIHYLNSQLDTYVGHASLQNKDFYREHIPEFVLQESQDKVELLRSDSLVKASTTVTVADGMVASAHFSGGVQIRGIDLSTDTLVFNTFSFIKKGTYFAEETRNPIVIGEALAKKLNASLRSKIVLTFQRTDGEITSGAFRVIGIVKTPNSTLDQMRVFVRQTDLQKLMSDTEAIHEIAFKLIRPEWAKTFATNSAGILSPSDTLLTWYETAPELAYMDSSMDLSLYIFMGIIVLALALGILNTMLMAILERTRELGMLMAIGTPRPFLFRLILLETLFLSGIGAPFGLLISVITVNWTGTYGLDFSSFSEGLAMYGMGNFIYPELKSDYIIGITLLIFFAALLSAIYPAIKAIKLKPLEAIRNH